MSSIQGILRDHAGSKLHPQTHSDVVLVPGEDGLPAALRDTGIYLEKAAA